MCAAEASQMDTFLKYLPIFPASYALYMLARQIWADVVRPMKRDGQIGNSTDKVPFWRRPIPVMIVLVILSWLPLLMTQFWQPSAAPQPRVSFDYQRKEPWLTPPSKRPSVNDWLVSLRVTPESPAKLVNARAYLTSIRRKIDNNWSVPLNQSIRPQLAWPEYDKSFQVRDVVGPDFLDLFNLTSDGKILSLINSMRQQKELAELNNLPSGEYKIIISVNADNLDKPVSATINLRWYGDVTKLAIDPNFIDK
jgi:hypothetical protein